MGLKTLLMVVLTGGAFSSPGDNQQLLLLQSFVSLHGRLQGQLTQIRRQTPMEAMLSLAQAGKVSRSNISWFRLCCSHSNVNHPVVCSDG